MMFTAQFIGASLDPPYAQAALAFGADAVAYLTQLVCAVLAPVLAGIALLSAALIVGLR